MITKERLEEALARYRQGDREDLKTLLEDVHAADIAEQLVELSEEDRVALLHWLEPEQAAEVLESYDPVEQSEILVRLDEDVAAQVLNAMPNDNIADVLAETPPEQASGLLNLMEAEEAEYVRELLEYLGDTAGGLMTTEFVALQQDLAAGEAIAALRDLAPAAETIYYVYVVDAGNRLVGVLSLRDLIVAPPEAPLAAIMRTKVISIGTGTDQEEVARIVARYDLLAVPVTDEAGRLVGIVTVDDVIDVLTEEATEDIMKLTANVSAEEDEGEPSAWHRALRRLPWLIGLLAGSLIAGRVVEGFEGTLTAVPVLAFFMTAMAGQAGNVATQSMVMVVRGVATGELDRRELGRVVRREARVSTLIGIGNGLVLAVVAGLWLGDPVFGLVIGAALWVNMSVAGIAGSFFPLLLMRLGTDPAEASGPVVTTLTDIISMLIYFSLATAYLGWIIGGG